MNLQQSQSAYNQQIGQMQMQMEDQNKDCQNEIQELHQHKSSQSQAQQKQNRELDEQQKQSSDEQSERSRSRDMPRKHKRKYTIEDQNNLSKLRAGQLHYHQYLQKQQEFHTNQETLRSHLRIQQNRLQPIDMFVKIVYTYKGKYLYDAKDKSIMIQPKKYLNSLTVDRLKQMIDPAQKLLKAQEKIQIQCQNQQNQQQINNNEFKYSNYWKNLIKLIQYKIQKKQKKIQSNLNSQQKDSDLKPEFKNKIKKMLDKSIQQLKKLSSKIQLMTMNPKFANDLEYWKNIQEKIKGKLYQHNLVAFYEHFKDSILPERSQIDADDEYQQEQPISPILAPISSINQKLLTTQQIQKQQRGKLSSLIFKQEFQKHREKLQDNLSLPKNHNLLSKDFVNQSNKTYDFITQQIMQFQKYKRMESDQQQFDEWLPTQTEGRFRDRKPQYINRVRVSYENSKLQHGNAESQPIKAIQGYKFNIFYPDLYDKQKTPQYYLEAMQNPDYCLIKFKAGPPYKDVAFKILRKQWDFTQKSGFQSIFAKGILHLYFNFKKPRYRI